MDAFMHRIPTTCRKRRLISNEVKSPSSVLEMNFNSSSLLDRRGFSASSPADYALRSTSPFESERKIQTSRQARDEASTLPRLSPIASVTTTTTVPTECSPTSEFSNLATHKSDHSCEIHEAPLDMSQISILAPLGMGSTASVFKVLRTNSEVKASNSHLALKVMKIGKHNDEHWLRERTVLELLKDEPSVVKLVAAFEMAYIPSPPVGAFFDAETPVHALALEHCPRGELYGIVAQFEHGLPEPVAKIYARQIWRAVCGCHRLGVTHRDIKPENIVVAADWSLRLADFGIALIGKSLTRERGGTETYIAPEVNSNVPYDPSLADVWSAGVTCFTLLCGRPPFFASNTKDKFFCCAKEGAWDKFWLWHENKRRSLNIAPLDAAAKRFLQRALDPSPRWRPSAAAMLDDPWLFDASPGGAGPGDAELGSLMTDLGVKSPHID